jgi:lipopolysaccharide biosynthesis protein
MMLPRTARKKDELQVIGSLLDGDWYVGLYRDVVKTELEPGLHYLLHGAAEGRDPHPLFSTTFYLRNNPDVVKSRENPLVHYLRYGGLERRDPHPLFDTKWYLDQPRGPKNLSTNPLLHFLQIGSDQKLDPHPLFSTAFYTDENPQVSGNQLIHYVRYGAREKRNPHPLFNTDWYLGQSGAVGTSIENPLVHFLAHWKALKLDPHPLFRCLWYWNENPDVAKAAVNPLIHYVSDGWKEGRQPFPLFDSHGYLATNPDVAATPVDPLAHYITKGWKEGRIPHPLFAQDAYLSKNVRREDLSENPLSHYIRSGAKQGFDPNPFFHTTWYVQEHDDILPAGLNPLEHYATAGWRAGRNPSPLFDVEYYLAFNSDVANSNQEPLTHFLESGAAEGRQPRRPDADVDICEVMDIPYEVVRPAGKITGKDVCLFVSYTRDGRIYDHVLHYLRALQSARLTIVLILCTDGISQPLPVSIDFVDGIIVRSNHGWDFAAWAAALTIFPDLWTARNLVLANDSVYGPVANAGLQEIIERIRSTDCDIVALTDSYQNNHHFMSYFIGLSSSGLKSLSVRRFWGDVKSIKAKADVIGSYELIPLEQWGRSEVRVEIVFPTRNDVTPPINPTLVLWRDLLNAGFPFIKVQLLRDELRHADAMGWEESLRRNAPLVTMIKTHLSETRINGVRERRPVPAPRRRFVRRMALTTVYGATEGIRPTEATDLALEVPFDVSTDLEALPEKIAVLVHIFYPDIASELEVMLRNIPVQADVFISTDSEDKSRLISKVFEHYSNGSVSLRVFPNVGRDIAPTLVGYAEVFQEYDIFLHIHSKRSPHDTRFAGWRSFLLENLLGSTDVVRSILRLLMCKEVGVVFSQHFPPVRQWLNWGYDYDDAKALLAKMGVSLSRDFVLEFPSSSFFWARSAAIAPLLDLALSWSDFPEEAGQTDGTLAHAIERSILYCAEGAGFRWVKVGQHKNLPCETLVPVSDPGELDGYVDYVHRPLLGNRIHFSSQMRRIGGIRAVATRRSPNLRPRLNLLVPTLHPSLTFGGIATALSTLGELTKHLADWDVRILCTSYRVDLASMASLTGYCLLSLGGASDGFSRVVVDLSDSEGGELDVRSADFFIATAWWTATLAYELQAKQAGYYGAPRSMIYLIQDHEPGFYSWSSDFAEALATYRAPEKTIALINSEELASFMVRHYGYRDAYVVRYRANPAIRRSLARRPRERMILIYGRPQTARNCFEALCAGLIAWQQNEPTIAQRWRIVSAGEVYPPSAAGVVQNLEVVGKLTLEAYAEILSRASVGISLMLSPHPSYPPLEMAHAGLRTITNSYECKDLRLRNPNFISLDSLTPDVLAGAISQAVAMAEGSIGEIVPYSEIRDIACELPDFDPGALAKRLRKQAHTHDPAVARDLLHQP